MTKINRRAALVSSAGAMALATAPIVKPSSARAENSSDEASRINVWFEQRFNAWIDRSPMSKAYLGLKEDMDQWDNISAEHEKGDFELAQKDLADLTANFDPSKLPSEAALSYRLYAYEAQAKIDHYPWRHHDYPVNQMFGWQQSIPNFLMNIHGVSDISDAEAYIARLTKVPEIVGQLIDGIKAREAKGVMPPKFVYKYVLDQSRDVLAGQPFGGDEDSALFADIRGKIEKLDVNAGVRQKLIADARAAMIDKVKPAYDELIALAEAQEARATTDDGVWKLPDGEAFYAHMLGRHTTTAMTAAEIHQFGLDEVERIHGDMRAIMTQVGFSGDLKAFFKFMQDDPQFYYPGTPEGKAAFLARTHDIIDAISARLDEMFIIKPKAALEVREVEPYRQKGSASAFYQGPGAFDGRPGIYYANTYDMKAMPKYEMEALAYHEAIPGHHMQIAISQELENIPKFRKFTDSYTAYVEGWGLYSERLPKEFGFYSDPYSDFGRLSMELWRAIRLVLDTGLHSGAYKWSREKAMQYAADNSPSSPGDIKTEVERFIVMPGQATAYKIGMTKIIDLREKARAALGGTFDIRRYHDLVLGSGALPLTILEDVVDGWVKTQKA